MIGHQHADLDGRGQQFASGSGDARSPREAKAAQTRDPARSAVDGDARRGKQIFGLRIAQHTGSCADSTTPASNAVISDAVRPRVCERDGRFGETIGSDM